MVCIDTLLWMNFDGFLILVFSGPGFSMNWNESSDSFPATLLATETLQSAVIVGEGLWGVTTPSSIVSVLWLAPLPFKKCLKELRFLGPSAWFFWPPFPSSSVGEPGLCGEARSNFSLFALRKPFCRPFLWFNPPTSESLWVDKSCSEPVRPKLFPKTSEYLGLWYLCAGTFRSICLESPTDTWKRDVVTGRGRMCCIFGFMTGVGRGGLVMLNSLYRSTCSDTAYSSRKSLSKKSTVCPDITVIMFLSSRDELQVKLQEKKQERKPKRWFKVDKKYEIKHRETQLLEFYYLRPFKEYIHIHTLSYLAGFG